MRSALALVLLTLAGVCGAEQLTCPTTSTLVVDHGQYTSRPGVTFVMENFSAKMVPKSHRMPQCEGKIKNIERGRVVVSQQTLTLLFDEKLKKAPKSKISDLKVKTDGDHVVLSGKVHKVIGIPFSVEGPVDSPDGRVLRLQAEKVHAIGIPVVGLLDALGMELGDLLHASNKGVTVKGQSILFDPDKIGDIRGHIQHVQVGNNDLVIDFDNNAQQAKK